jgi:hypothetical protein
MAAAHIAEAGDNDAKGFFRVHLATPDIRIALVEVASPHPALRADLPIEGR